MMDKYHVVCGTVARAILSDLFLVVIKLKTIFVL